MNKLLKNQEKLVENINFYDLLLIDGVHFIPKNGQWEEIFKNNVLIKEVKQRRQNIFKDTEYAVFFKKTRNEILGGASEEQETNKEDKKKEIRERLKSGEKLEAVYEIGDKKQPKLLDNYTRRYSYDKKIQHSIVLEPYRGENVVYVDENDREYWVLPKEVNIDVTNSVREYLAYQYIEFIENIIIKLVKNRIDNQLRYGYLNHLYYHPDIDAEYCNVREKFIYDLAGTQVTSSVERIFEDGTLQGYDTYLKIENNDILLESRNIEYNAKEHKEWIIITKRDDLDGRLAKKIINACPPLDSRKIALYCPTQKQRNNFSRVEKENIEYNLRQQLFEMQLKIEENETQMTDSEKETYYYYNCS